MGVLVREGVTDTDDEGLGLVDVAEDADGDFEMDTGVFVARVAEVDAED